jgi:hypothetical protein
MAKLGNIMVELANTFFDERFFPKISKKEPRRLLIFTFEVIDMIRVDR